MTSTIPATTSRVTRLDNVNEYALDVNAVAYATLSFGMSTEVIDWQKGKGNFKPEDIADTAGALAVQ